MYKFYINKSLYFDMPAVRDKISAIKTVISTTKYIIIGAARKSRRQANDVEIISLLSYVIIILFYLFQTILG